MTSHTETASTDDLSFWTKRNLEFRVLILGRANAGKTTILERVAGAAIYEAEVRRDGKLLPAQIIRGQSDRGLHNVDDEIRFYSRPGFIFHDSRGVEAGSTEELSTVQQFVENRSSATSVRKQLHAIWMCIPLDESRELFEGERAPFSWSKGAAALVVIFTKRDGAVIKETSQIIDQITKDSPGITIGRSVKTEARRKADFQVINRVNELEGELRRLSLADDAMVFLTTSGMEEQTVDTDNTCQQLIDLTEECLTGPRIKTLLSVVWGRNLSKRGFWAIYWMLISNHWGAIKLGSGAPDTCKMIEAIIQDVMDHCHDHCLDHYRGFLLDHRRHADEDHITCLESLFSPILHRSNLGLSDVDVLTLAVLVLVVMHAVHAEVLSMSSTPENWILAIGSFLRHHEGPVQEKVHTISSQVAVIVGEMKNRNIISQLHSIGAWKFSEQEAEMFAKRLAKCVEANLV